MGDLLSALTPKSPFSHVVKFVQKEQDTGWKRIGHEPFNKPMLLHKVIGSLKHSVGADMGVWKYENTLEALDHLRSWWTKTHNIVTLRFQDLPSTFYQSNLSCQSPLCSINHLKQQNCSTELTKNS